MKKYQLIVLIICVALLSMSATLLSYSFYKIKHIEVIPMDIRVGNLIGINIDGDALHFGTVMGTGCSTRIITARHNYGYPVKVIIRVVGELESWTYIEKNDFVLNENQEEQVKFKVCAPEGEAKDIEHTSAARIVFKRA